MDVARHVSLHIVDPRVLSQWHYMTWHHMTWRALSAWPSPLVLTWQAVVAVASWAIGLGSLLVAPVAGVVLADYWQGLILVHFSAQFKRFLWDWGCIEGMSGGVQWVLGSLKWVLGSVKWVLGSIRGCMGCILCQKRPAQVELESGRV